MEETAASVARYLSQERWIEVSTREMVDKTMRFLARRCRPTAA